MRNDSLGLCLVLGLGACAKSEPSKAVPVGTATIASAPVAPHVAPTLEVRWTVDQTKAKPPLTGGAKDDLTKHIVPLDLTLTLDGHTQSMSLETDGAAAYSDACSRVSFFYAGVNILFELDRTPDGRVALKRTRTSESAPTQSKQLSVFDVPSDAKLVQEITTIAPGGKRTTKSCSAASL